MFALVKTGRDILPLRGLDSIGRLIPQISVTLKKTDLVLWLSHLVSEICGSFEFDGGIWARGLTGGA